MESKACNLRTRWGSRSCVNCIVIRNVGWSPSLFWWVLEAFTNLASNAVSLRFATAWTWVDCGCKIQRSDRSANDAQYSKHWHPSFWHETGTVQRRWWPSGWRWQEKYYKTRWHTGILTRCQERRQLKNQLEANNSQIQITVTHLILH